MLEKIRTVLRWCLSETTDDVVIWHRFAYYVRNLVFLTVMTWREFLNVITPLFRLLIIYSRNLHFLSEKFISLHTNLSHVVLCHRLKWIGFCLYLMNNLIYLSFFAVAGRSDSTAMIEEFQCQLMQPTFFSSIKAQEKPSEISWNSLRWHLWHFIKSVLEILLTSILE